MRLKLFPLLLMVSVLVMTSNVQLASAAITTTYSSGMDARLCGGIQSPVTITSSTSGTQKVWRTSQIPNVAFNVTVLKDVQNVQPPADRSMTLTLKRDGGKVLTFVGGKVAEATISDYGNVYNEADTSDPGNLGSYQLWGAVDITASAGPYAAFHTIFYNTQRQTYASQPNNTIIQRFSQYPNWSTRCYLRVDVDSYKSIMKAIGEDVGDGEAPAEDPATLGSLGAETTDIGEITPGGDDYGSCGKPKLDSSIFTYAFCNLLLSFVDLLKYFLP